VYATQFSGRTGTFSLCNLFPFLSVDAPVITTTKSEHRICEGTVDFDCRSRIPRRSWRLLLWVARYHTCATERSKNSVREGVFVHYPILPFVGGGAGETQSRMRKNFLTVFQSSSLRKETEELSHYRHARVFCSPSIPGYEVIFFGSQLGHDKEVGRTEKDAVRRKMGSVVGPSLKRKYRSPRFVGTALCGSEVRISMKGQGSSFCSHPV